MKLRTQLKLKRKSKDYALAISTLNFTQKNAQKLWRTPPLTSIMGVYGRVPQKCIEKKVKTDKQNKPCQDVKLLNVTIAKFCSFILEWHSCIFILEWHSTN
ncbi:hypothetical protein MKW98_027787 [Papaver atlanticum]|uniref:Uncharacterized protein n=1 Tax=Papaver atlanticum TaxID=357466 RepID=A0AAD4XFW2_9MAGN|nr:hypothetical protein MKW98_027787 [Papaver atlanticum]